ncbi:hypothetical protein AU381_12390 [Sinorhizobium glycinis]|uniref:Uncharacterized protein n=1 Tax=Sinorhizobium glycinis TaxID=1472378 RepID=A0A178XYQ0_9HYPH|nr:hypothetical protein AU381_12390 [Sinorhizobium glycinis]
MLHGLGLEESEGSAVVSWLFFSTADQVLWMIFRSNSPLRKFVNGIIRMRCPNRLARTEPLCFRGLRWSLFLNPIIDYRPFDDAPLPFPFLKQITVASAQEHLLYLACCVGTALQRGEITLDGGLCRAQELNDYVRKLVDVARLSFEDVECMLNKPCGRAGVASVIVACIGPITAAQCSLVCPVDSSTVAMETVADCFSVE